ncbi:hypothetical protein PMKS-003948 [Pichia membranifaciens]|uniref:Uncharacterized protein n=1 Tax=Pichia membranifaciens TaxID=4926 RepID=A0A1Q2YLK2_9ASCO|nr:hypothetical protein PMKS-003948 [Pichia membranifaciens]
MAQRIRPQLASLPNMAVLTRAEFEMELAAFLASASFLALWTLMVMNLVAPSPHVGTYHAGALDETGDRVRHSVVLEAAGDEFWERVRRHDPFGAGKPVLVVGAELSSDIVDPSPDLVHLESLANDTGRHRQRLGHVKRLPAMQRLVRMLDEFLGVAEAALPGDGVGAAGVDQN